MTKNEALELAIEVLDKEYEEALLPRICFSEETAERLNKLPNIILEAIEILKGLKDA